MSAERSFPGRLRRVVLSLVAVAAGWAAAAIATLPFQVWQLTRNAGAGQAGRDFVRGAALWMGFTLGIAGGTWLVVVLAVALLVPPEWVIRHRWAIAAAGAATPVLYLAHRLGVWDAFLTPELENPLYSALLQMYTAFAVVFAFASTFGYSWLLGRAER